MSERSTTWTCQTAGTGGDGSCTVSVLVCNVNVTLRDQRYVPRILFMWPNGRYLIYVPTAGVLRDEHNSQQPEDQDAGLSMKHPSNPSLASFLQPSSLSPVRKYSSSLSVIAFVVSRWAVLGTYPLRHSYRTVVSYTNSMHVTSTVVAITSYGILLSCVIASSTS